MALGTATTDTQGNSVPPPPPEDATSLSSLATAAANKYGIPASWFRSLIGKGEGGFKDPDGVSPKGARGVGQLMPKTAEAVGVEDVDDPQDNLDGSAKYAAQMWRRYKGNAKLATAAYNAGPENADKHGENWDAYPKAKETKPYVQRVGLPTFDELEKTAKPPPSFDNLEKQFDTPPPPKPTPRQQVAATELRAAPDAITQFSRDAVGLTKENAHPYLEDMQKLDKEPKNLFSGFADFPRQTNDLLGVLTSPGAGLAQAAAERTDIADVGAPGAGGPETHGAAERLSNAGQVGAMLQPLPPVGEAVKLAGRAGEEVAAAAKAAGMSVEEYRASKATAPRPPNALKSMAQRSDVAVQRKAEKLITDRLRRDSGRAPTAQEMLEHASRTPEKPMTLMDVGGPATKGLAGMVARSPKGEGSAKITNFLADRSTMQGPRLESDVQRNIGAGSSRQTIRSLQDAQKKAASPLYDDAFEANPVIHSSVIDQIVRSDQGAPLWKEAQSRARARMVGTDNPIPDKYSLRVMDQFKQLLDDKIGAAKRAGENNTAGFYLDIKHRLVNELDGADQTGLYKKARKTFSDSATSKDAVEFGRTALKMNAEDIADHLRGLSDGDKELARLGLAESLRDKIRATDVGRNAATKLARNRALEDQIAPFFKSPKALQKFLDSALAEDTMFRTENEVVKGSQTAARSAEDRSDDAKLIGHGVRAASHLSRGNIPGAALSAGKAAYEYAMRPNPAVGDRVADILTTPIASNDLARRLLAQSQMKNASRNALKGAVAPSAIGGPQP